MAKVEDSKRYKWAYPSDWLRDRLDEARNAGDCQTLWSYACTLYEGITEDEIQDRFQGEMDADGYFKPERIQL